jgi:uncharacterized protein (TIGR00266 family)
MTADNYKIEGSDLQFVQVTLLPGESAVGEPGSMMYLDEGVTMESKLGDGIDEGLFSRLAGAFKRSFSGENIFSTIFDNPTQRTLRVAFAAPSPGKIMAVDLAANGGTIICQKGAFLAGSHGVRVGVAFKKRLRVGFFGGEGFMMQKLTGKGTVFIHASGALTAMQLAPGQALQVDTGCLAALQTSASYDIKYVGKLKTSFFGGEGMFNAYLKGPGTVWIQSLPMKRLAASIAAGSMRQRGALSGRLLYLGIVIVGVIAALSGTGEP